MTTPVDDLAAALGGTEQLVGLIGPDAWALPTPCTGWSVRDVVNHLVGGNLLFVRVLGGEPLPPRDELIAAAKTDRLGDDAAGAYRASAAEVVDAFLSLHQFIHTYKRSDIGAFLGTGQRLDRQEMQRRLHRVSYLVTGQRLFFYSGEQAERLEEATAWIETARAIWEARMDRLDEHLKEIQKGRINE